MGDKVTGRRPQAPRPGKLAPECRPQPACPKRRGLTSQARRAASAIPHVLPALRVDGQQRTWGCLSRLALALRPSLWRVGPRTPSPFHMTLVRAVGECTTGMLPSPVRRKRRTGTWHLVQLCSCRHRVPESCRHARRAGRSVLHMEPVMACRTTSALRIWNWRTDVKVIGLIVATLGVLLLAGGTAGAAPAISLYVAANGSDALSAPSPRPTRRRAWVPSPRWSAPAMRSASASRPAPFPPAG